MKRWERLYHPLRIPRPERLRRWQLLTGYHQAEVVSDGIVALVRYRIAVPFAGAAGRRIAFVSDQHYRGNRKDRRLATAVERLLREISPDYLLLGGDVSSHGNEMKFLPDMLRRLSSAAAGARALLAVPGNWERGKCWISPEHWREIFSDGGFQLLYNQSWSDDLLYVHGSDDLSSDGVPAVPERWPEDRIGVLLAHRPDTVIALDRQNDLCGCRLALCGHTHGGQWRLPGIGALYDSSRYRRQFTYGCFERKDFGTRMIVSSGIGELSLPWRFNCRREVVLVEFFPEGEKNCG